MSLRDLTFEIAYGPGEDRLHRFYIPALKASVRYDRMTGFFTSSALAVAAAGVAHLVARGGRMRLLVGAQLAPDDVQAIQQGYSLEQRVAERMAAALRDPEALTDALLRRRLEVLAWMVAEGTLDLRVVLPRGLDGSPLPASEAQEYFHPKVGIFTDANGHQVAFSGSVNESETGWQHNYEQFVVFRSWTAEGRLYVAELTGRFERLWAGREPAWIALPVPEAVRQKLLRYYPTQPPTRDPLERTPAALEEARPAQAWITASEPVLFQFLRDAPHLLDADGLGAATSTVSPWPHQAQVAHQTVQRYPERRLLADEVGLGKTIEASLIVRQLWLSGLARRILLLAPKSVLRQWQEELYEKFALNVPCYDGQVFVDVFGAETLPTTPNPWDSVDFVLASSQLVKRRERQPALREARCWDLILVDEAHHARRKDFLNLNLYRPNRLLELLNALKERTDGLLLLTATPMQVHPIEVWDLLSLLGLSGEWGADGRNFLRFFEELRRPWEEADWKSIFRLVREEVTVEGGEDEAGLNPSFESLAQRRLGPVDWQRVRGLLANPDPGRTLPELSPSAREVAVLLAREHTPLRRLLFRHTRPLLREYAAQGLLQANVPERDPRLVWIPMRSEERALYDRIEEYITDFYQRYEEERHGRGFVMTVYRRRLTSSFYAVQRSLERHLAFLRGRPMELEDDDLEQDDLDLDISDELDEADRSRFQDEIAYVEDFLHALRSLGQHDSKVEQLLCDLEEVFRQRETVLVFTQYTDTMDFLRQELARVYGPQVACYSGRGGERWDGVMWTPVTKEEIKNDFRTGSALKILLCTEAASEGLNLQTCGVLINYDMPWNPMRVEQRIGRIDRIGQRYERVWVRNYFYEETVEAQVYQALSHRIDWFQDVVGPLQPILARVGQVIQSLALVPQVERQAAFAQEVQRLQADLDQAQAGLNLDEWVCSQPVCSQARSEAKCRSGDGTPLRSVPDYERDGTPLRSVPDYEPGTPFHSVPDYEPAAPVTLPELAHVLTTSTALGHRFRSHERLPGAFWLRREGGEVAVTFDPACYDAHPDTLQLLTYGNPLLTELLAVCSEPVCSQARSEAKCRSGDGIPLRSVPDYKPDYEPVLRLHTEEPLPRVAYYARDEQGQPRRLTRLADLRAALEGTVCSQARSEAECRSGDGTPRRSVPDYKPDYELVAAARQDFEAAVAALAQRLQQARERFQAAQRSAWEARARRILIEAALVELALGQKPELFDQSVYPTLFNEQAVQSLRRHNYPWAPLLRWVGAGVEPPRPTDPFFQAAQQEPPDRLRRRFAALTERAGQMLTELAP